MNNEDLEKEENIFQSSYLEVKYDLKSSNNNDYPFLLAKYLKKTFYKSNTHLLDIGCGRGEMLRAFHANNFEVSGTDISPQSEEDCGEFDFKIGNLEKEKLNYPDKKFNCIFAKSVIEHLRSPINLLSESHRMLKDNGVCIIMTPSWVHNAWGPFYIDFTHVSPFTQTSLKDAMKMAGFKSIEVYHFYQLPFIWKYPYLTILPKFISLLPLRYRPFYDSKWPDSLNKLIRFSNEVMLLAVGIK